MTAKTTIQDFYKGVLSAVNCTVDDSGLVSFTRPGGDPTPATISDERLVLPTEERLDEGINEGLIAFHPLAENLARQGQSPVLVYLRDKARALVSYYLVELTTELLRVAADTSLHNDLPPECTEYLRKVTKADKEMLKRWNSLIGAASKKANGIVTLYLRNGGVYHGEKVNRLCNIRVPLLAELEDTKDRKVYGVDLRRKDVETLAALLRYIMPFGDDPEEYSVGSSSNLAPYFVALMKAYGKAMTQLNRIVHKYAKPMELNLTEIDLTYLDEIDNVKQFYGKIPALRGNQGGASKMEKHADEPSEPREPAQPKAPREPAQPREPVTPAPIHEPRAPTQPQQAPQRPKSVSEFLGTAQSNPMAGQHPPGGVPQQPGGYPGAPPMGGHPMPNHGMPHPQQGYPMPGGGHPMQSHHPQPTQPSGPVQLPWASGPQTAPAGGGNPYAVLSGGGVHHQGGGQQGGGHGGGHQGGGLL